MKNKKLKLHIPGIAIFDILLIIFFGIVASNFFSLYNLILILRNTCTLLIAALAMNITIMVTKNNLSTGSVISTAAVLTAILSNKGYPTVIVIAISLLVGAVVGAINGYLISMLKFDYWVVTFGMMSVMAGVALILTDGKTISFTNETLNFIGNARTVGGIYWLIIFTALITGFMIWVERRTRFGFNTFSIGGSPVVAANSGINVEKNVFFVYVVSGILAAISGIFVACMSNAGSPTVGNDYTFNAMAAVIIGGTPFAGGKGGYVGTVFGTLLLRILQSGLSLMGIEATWQKAITGIIIVALIVIDVLNEHRTVKNGLRRVYNDVK